jgi:hypothetical protein
MRIPLSPYPEWWHDDDTTDADRYRWSMQERCRRQAVRQQTAYAQRVENTAEREQRRQEAHPLTVDVSDYR